MLIGVDLDNTIIKYDGLFRRLAAEYGWLSDDGVMSKPEVRTALWAQEGGHQGWTDIQALVYGPRIVEANPFPGALAFFEQCKVMGVETRIVSHKTDYAASDKNKEYNLRDKGMDWLKEHGFFADSTSLESDKVYFAHTRAEKVDIISDLGCELFIDDLMEVFMEPGYPDAAEKVLFAPSSKEAPADFKGMHCTHWDQMTARLEVLCAAR